MLHQNPTLIDAAANGNTEQVRLLLAAKADPNTQNERKETALLHAIENGYETIIQCLIDAGADLEQGATNPLAFAI